MQAKKKKWLTAVPLLLGCGYLAINPAPVYGSLPVFDWTNWLSLGSIWGQDISNGAKLIATYNEAVQIYKTGVQSYELGKQMAQRIGNKDLWKTAAFAVGSEVAQQHYNEQINWSAVMNGDVMNAGAAWHQSTLSGGNAGYLGASTAPNSFRMANYASMQMLDATSQRCAQILANYKSTQDANQAAQSKLASDTYNASDLNNATVAVLNVISGGHMNLQNQAQASGNVQACLAEQQTLQAKIQRDSLAAEQNFYAEVAGAKANSPVLLDPAQTAAIVGGGYLEP